VFVGGCSRSGTTLLGAMLGVGPAAVTVPEAEFKWQLFQDAGPAGAEPAKARLDTAALARRLRGDRMFRLWDVDLPSNDRSTITYRELLDGLVSSYAARVGKPDAEVWIDHTPGNIRYGMTLHRTFPAARFLHLVRDGRAVAASVLPLDWGPNSAGESGTYWATQLAAGFALETALGPEVVMRVRYEDLVREPGRTLASVCEFLDMPFRDDMVQARDYRVGAYEKDQQRLVAGPPQPSRIDAWREDLTMRQIRDFERATGELLEYLGYPLVLGAAARRPSRTQRLVTMVASNGRRWTVDKVRFRRRIARSQRSS
jgi:hypothetical protein